MKHISKSVNYLVKAFAVVSIVILSKSAFSADNALIDNFNHVVNTNSGLPRLLLSDTTAGGKTTTKLTVLSGVIQVKGEIIPPRGQPGWASLILPLSQMGEPTNASEFEGVRLLIKINNGNISISANSLDITNFDYHSSPVIVSSDGNFHEVKIPFDSMKRMWSEQTTLNTETLNSLSIVAFSPKQAKFSFTVDKVDFY
ncbi:MAG: CIA30 family protein [Thalassotalea sp.]